MSIGKLCNREVIVVDCNKDALDAAKLMREHHVGDLVAIEQRGGIAVPVGIITDRDLVLEVLAQSIDPTSVTVGDIMSADIQTAQEDDDLFEALDGMADKGVRRLLIVNEQGGLEGILTMDDVLELVSEQISALVNVIGRQQNRERRIRS
jgi:predicted transcriptional regulator